MGALATESFCFDLSDTVPPLSGEHVTLLREAEDPGEGASPGIDGRVEEYLERIELSVSPQERAELLEELADIFEHEEEDVDRAFTARLMAYAQAPRAKAWSKLDEMAAITGRWAELADEEAAVAGNLPPQQREEGWLRVARFYEERLQDSERAIECYQEALSEEGWSEAGDALEVLLRRCDRVPELILLLRRRLRWAGEEEGLAIQREIAELYEERLGDRARAIEQLEAVRGQRPGDLDSLRGLERLYRQQGPMENHKRVLWELIGLVGDAGELVALYRRAAALCEELGDLTRAAECLEWVVSYEPDALDAYADLERLYCADRRWPAAVEVFTRHAQILENGSRAALLLRAAEITEKELDDPQTAVDLYLKALDAGAEDEGALARLARAAELANDPQSAVRALERLARRSERREERLRLFLRAAELAEERLDRPDIALPLLESALACDADCIPALAALARVKAELGDPPDALSLLSDALLRAGEVEKRVPLLLEAGHICAGANQVNQAITHYLRVLELAPDHIVATRRASELLWEAGRVGETVPLLERLVDWEVDAQSRAVLLVRLGTAARSLGDLEEAEKALAAAAELDPEGEVGALRELGTTLVERGAWTEALRAFERLEAASVPLDPELHYQLALCCARTGDEDRAGRHLTAGLEREPGHRPSLLLQAELAEHDPESLVSAKRALLKIAAGDEERARLLAEIGDVCETRLEDPARALGAYLEALEFEPTRRQPIFRCFDLLAELERWDESLAYLERLVALEQDSYYRAHYRHAAGVICRDEIRSAERAAEHFAAALEDDPRLDVCWDDLERLLTEREDWEALRASYCAALRRLRPEDREERARAAALWSRLGELCVARFDRDVGLEALEVAAHLDRGKSERHERITELCIEAGPDYLDRAIEHQQALLDVDPQQVGPYYTLARLYRETLKDERARACLAAARVIEERGLCAASEEADVGALGAREPKPGPNQGALTAEAWRRLRHPSEEALLGELFEAVAPAIALWQARPRADFSLDRDAAVSPGARHPFARAFSNVVRAFGLPTPELYVRPSQRRPALFAHCKTEGEVVPAVVLGRPLVAEGRTVRELEIVLALQFAYLLPERRVRLLLPRPPQLAHVLEAALAIADEPDGSRGRPRSRTRDLLERSLSPAELDHVADLGRRLRERDIDSQRAATEWMRATTLTALRAALVLAPGPESCVKVLEEQENRADREARARSIFTICRQSVASEVLDAREQLGS